MLPGGEALRRLVSLVRGYVGDELGWDVRLVLKKEEVPPLKLDGNVRLGWTTWLASRPIEGDVGDLAVNPSRGGASAQRHASDASAPSSRELSA